MKAFTTTNVMTILVFAIMPSAAHAQDARWFKSFGRNASEHCRVSHGVSFDVGKR